MSSRYSVPMSCVEGDNRMKYKRALIQCRRCGKWSGWISRTEGGVKTIDTTCSCCGRRLRHTENADPNRQYVNCYRPGRGAHNRTSSIIRFEACHDDVAVKQVAASRNSRGQMEKADLLGRSQGFVKAKDYDDVRLR